MFYPRHIPDLRRSRKGYWPSSSPLRRRRGSLLCFAGIWLSAHLQALPLTVLTDVEDLLQPGQIILTFDDGPSPGITDGLLNVLSQEGVQATFFFVGSRAAAAPELVQRTWDEGHEVGAHGWDSDWPALFDGYEELADIKRSHQVLAGQGRVRFRRPWLYRPPRGLVSPAVAKLEGNCTIQIGYVSAFVPDASAEESDAEALISELQAKLVKDRGGAVVLHSHRYRSDGTGFVDKSWLPGAVKRLIQWAKAKGFEFVNYAPRAECLVST